MWDGGRTELIGDLGGLTVVVGKLKVWGRNAPERPPNFGLRVMASLDFIFIF